jgi:hypothetical protein
MRGPKTLKKNDKRRERRMKAIKKIPNKWQEPMSIQGTYRNTVCVFVFLVSFSVAHSHCHTYSLYPNFCWLLFCWFMFIFVTRRRSSLVVARHSSSLVTRRHSSSLVVARRHSLLVLNSSSHCLSHARTHTHSLSTLSLSCWLSLLLMAFSFIALRPPSPSISLLVSLHLTLFSLRSLPTTIN